MAIRSICYHSTRYYYHADVAAYLDEKMIEYGVGEAWAPDQNPNVNSGADRGHSHATQKVIMPGDVIQTDFGIRVYDRWVTDIQRFAYVLKQDEKKPPVDIQFYWESGRDGSKAAFSAIGRSQCPLCNGEIAASNSMQC